jgi:hypothetical protein
MQEEQKFFEIDWGEYADIKRDQMIDREIEAKEKAWKSLKSLKWKEIFTGSYHTSALFVRKERDYLLSVGTGSLYGGSPVESPDQSVNQSTFEVAVLDLSAESDENEWVTSSFFRSEDGMVARMSSERLLEFLEYQDIKLPTITSRHFNGNV